MRRYINILSVVAALSMCSCSDSALEAELDRAEAVMAEHPDSALHIIGRTRATGSKKQNARRALLYSMALDKNYIDVTSDSLVTLAHDYYRNHGSERERFLSKFYYACYLRNCNDLPGALCMMHDCIEPGIASGDHYHLGVLYGQIADIYSRQYNYDNTISYELLALEQYRCCNASANEGLIYTDIGHSLACLRRHDEAIDNYRKALRIFEELRDTAHIDDALSNMAYSYIHNNQIDSAELAIRRITRPYEFTEYALLCDIYRLRKQHGTARDYLAKAREYICDRRTSACVSLYGSSIDMQEGRYKEAAEQTKHYAHIQDSLVFIALKQSAASVHRDHLQELYHRANENADLLRQRFWLSIALTVVVAGAIIYYIIYVMRKRRRIARLRYIQSLRESRRMSQQIDIQTEQVQHMQRLICRSLAPIDRIATTYYERKDSKTAQAGIYRDVGRLLDSYVQDSKVKEQLEYTVNIGRDNIMKSIRRELPQLSDKEFDLLLYIYAGFSTSTIALFTGDKPNNIYLRKCRLKNKIAKSDAPSRSIFIDNMA